MRKNKLIFAGEKKVASHSPTGSVLSGVDTGDACRVVVTREVDVGRNSERAWVFGATHAGPMKPHAVATEPRATENVVSLMGRNWVILQEQ